MLKLAALTLLLSGCQTPLVLDREGEVRTVTVLCVLASCTKLFENMDNDPRRVTVTCVFAKCASMPSRRDLQ